MFLRQANYDPIKVTHLSGPIVARLDMDDFLKFHFIIFLYIQSPTQENILYSFYKLVFHKHV